MKRLIKAEILEKKYKDLKFKYDTNTNMISYENSQQEIYETQLSKEKWDNNELESFYSYINPNLYSFDELSSKAQENAVGNVAIFNAFNDMLSEEYEKILKDKFPNSDLGFCYNLNYSQGDGFGLIGSFTLSDLEKFTNITLSEKAKEDLEAFVDRDNVKINNFNGKCFFTKNMIDVQQCFENTDESFEYGYDFTEQEIEDCKEELKKFDKTVVEKLSEFCNEMKEYGYNFFADMNIYIDYIENNNIKFDIDGDIAYSKI